jgi:hypothetical protein
MVGGGSCNAEEMAECRKVEDKQGDQQTLLLLGAADFTARAAQALGKREVN